MKGRQQLRTSRWSGFTIVELMLATAVFSVTLLIALNGFLQIGRLFYKGVSNTQTQAIARQILNDVSRNVQFAPEVSTLQTSPNPGPGNYHYYCIGSNRYTYTTTSSGDAIKLDVTQARNTAPGSSGGNFGLLKDTLPGSGGCASPCVTVSPKVPSGCEPFSSETELLGNKMRVGQLKIEEPAPSSTNPQNLYNITVMVIYGDDEVLEYSGGSSDPTTATCKGGSSNQQFCSVETLTTSVYKGLDI